MVDADIHDLGGAFETAPVAISQPVENKQSVRLPMSLADRTFLSAFSSGNLHSWLVVAQASTGSTGLSSNPWKPSSGSQNGDVSPHNDLWRESIPLRGAGHDDNPWSNDSHRPSSQSLPVRASSTPRLQSPVRNSQPVTTPTTATLSKEEKAAEMARRKEERKQVCYLFEAPGTPGLMSSNSG